MKSLESMSPHKLGESGLAEAVPHLVKYLESSSINDVRLAASAIGKLSGQYHKECNKAVPALLNALGSDGPQVRQYVLKSLLSLDVPHTRQTEQLVEELAESDEKDYNRRLAGELLSTVTGRPVKPEPTGHKHNEEGLVIAAQSRGKRKLVLNGEQKRILTLPLENPIQIKGVAGSGKTTVAIMRARHLVTSTAPDFFRDTHVCIFSYTKSLIKYIKSLLGSEVLGSKELTVVNFHKWAYGFLEERNFWGNHKVADNQYTNSILKSGLSDLKTVYPGRAILNKPLEFYKEEIAWLKGRMITQKQKYLDARRTGRGTTDRVQAGDKEVLWSLYVTYREKMNEQGMVDYDDFALKVLDCIEKEPAFVPPFSHIVVDEAQDLTAVQLICITRLVNPEINSITVIADAAQRIYKSGFSWSDVGINVRGGRTVELTRNYRNTRQIAEAAVSLLVHDPQQDDFSEHIIPEREGEPPHKIFISNGRESECLVAQLRSIDLSKESVVILHRERGGVVRLAEQLEENGFNPIDLSSANAGQIDMTGLYISTMSSVKGLEFDHVVLSELNDNLLPHPHGFTDDNDELHTSTERRLLYTCMTRARETLCLTYTETPSRYLDEIDRNTVKELQWD